MSRDCSRWDGWSLTHALPERQPLMPDPSIIPTVKAALEDYLGLVC